MKKRHSFIISGLLFFLCSCSGLFPAAEVSGTPQYGNESWMETQEQIIFNDNFSGASSWNLMSGMNDSRIALEHQGLRFVVNQTDFDFWTTPGKAFSNVIVAVDGSKLGGPDDNLFGVICRYQSTERFYAFLISSDGYYGVLKYRNGDYVLLSGPNMSFSEKITQGKGTNRIAAQCEGWSLTLYVNGEQLVNVSDLEYMNGDIGLIAGSQDEPGVDILFDNFIVYQPD